MPSQKDFVPVKDSEHPAAPGARQVSLANPNEIAEVALFVRRSAAGTALGPLVEELGKLRASDREYLSRADYAAQHGADPADIEKVVHFANENSLTVTNINLAHRAVRVTGTLGNFGKAFNLKLSTYQSSRGTYRGHAGPVQVPSDLADIVQAVFGLDNKPVGKTHFQVPRTKPRAGGAGAPFAGYTPNQVAQLYNFPSGLNGQGQCIGIIEFGGGYRKSDLDVYFQRLGIVPTPTVIAVSVGRSFNAPTGNSNGPDAEVCLDIEVVGAVAPAAQIVVYFAPNNTLGWFSAISTAIHDNFHQPSVISISWGGPENTWSGGALKAINLQFLAGARLGITVCVAAGDNGSSDGVTGPLSHVDFPASAPYALACGGTRLESSDGGISSEKVWNDGPMPHNPSSATGGGVSDFFPVPSYQSGAGVPPSVNPKQTAGRGVPDVAGEADPNTGYLVRVDGSDFVIGGTSAVAPLWAGLLALVNQKLGKPVGYINPLLYNQGMGGAGFNDIISGSNGAYRAGPGWDPCTGLGTPNGTVLSGIL
jgi:kumamolisin